LGAATALQKDILSFAELGASRVLGNNENWLEWHSRPRPWQFWGCGLAVKKSMRNLRDSKPDEQAALTRGVQDILYAGFASQSVWLEHSESPVATVSAALSE